MPLSLVDPVVRFPVLRVRSRPILPFSGAGGALGAAVPLTAFRPPRVGRPTSEPQGKPGGLGPLIAQAVAISFQSLDLLERRAREAARMLRTPRGEEALQTLAELVHGLQAMVDLVGATAESLHLDFDTLEDNTGGLASELTRRVAGRLVTHQIERDWSGLARTIEREFVSALAAWRQVVATLEDLSGGDDPAGYAA